LSDARDATLAFEAGEGGRMIEGYVGTTFVIGIIST
jgi:hypothetical protein